MLQRFRIALEQVKTGNTSENSLNDQNQNHIFFVIVCIEQTKLLKNIYNNRMTFIKV